MRVCKYLTSLALVMRTAAFACNATWQVGGITDHWNDPTNWTSCGGTFPDTATSTANFPMVAPTMQTIDINQDITLGTAPTLAFPSAATSYTFLSSTTSTLTLTGVSTGITLTGTQTFGDGAASYSNLVQLSGNTTLD